MFRDFRGACLMFAAISAITACTSGADTTAAFAASNQGWTSSEIDPAAHITSYTVAPIAVDWDPNGNPGGSIREQDLGNQWTCMSPPGALNGNWAKSFSGQIKFDVFIRYTSDLTWPAFALRGKNITLYCAKVPPILNSWTTMSATLTGAAWRVNNWETGSIATDAQMLEVLADLRGIFLFTEWKLGTPDDSNLDNFFMTGAPGPVCVGDVNHDGKTNVADFNILASHFATSVTPNTNGDLNGDGFVNVADFNILAGNFACGA